ncbi:hypothetical protein AALP_AA7G232500 [Arabis alpina]|uniref:C2H2-type domain-containing protein n=1 Tax=Arabis alpina TaxID=50452 RepID=A0A087GK11_ARAAL|nr:hypothetical protein AALP_AA7G232500 [Arabis alpina]
MSNPEKAPMNTEEEIIDESYSECSDWSDLEEGEIRELVLALPALSVSERMNANEEIRQKAVVAAGLVVAAAQEAGVETGTVEPSVAAGTIEPAVSAGTIEPPLAMGTTGSAVATATTEPMIGGSGESGKKKKVGRPRKGDVAAKAGGSGEEGEVVKKARKKGSSTLTHPPEGPPICNICRKEFVSWKGVFGHLRSHKNRDYKGYQPPPTFNAAEEGFGLGTGGVDIDLNDPPMGEEEEEPSESESVPQFDLNMFPTHEEEEEEREGDKAD